MFRELWQKYPPFADWSWDEQVLAQFEKLYALVLTGNQRQNLTRIVAPNDFWEKHLWDSLVAVAPYRSKQGLKVIDIGTGAGFPGLPVAITFPSWQITLLDSIRKKTAFVAETIAELGLTNAHTQTGRAEALVGDYDLSLVRAVGNVESCLNYGQNLLNASGTAILYRGKFDQSELPAHCSWQIKTIASLTTPISKGDRHCLYLVRKSPKVVGNMG